jgi:hypothetical protein
MAKLEYENSFENRMIMSEIRRELDNKVRPIYNKFDRCHDARHYDEVVNAVDTLLSIMTARGGFVSIADWTMMMVAAAYHDVGKLVSNRYHDFYSTLALRNDREIAKLLDSEQLNMAAMIISEHRSSTKATNHYSEILKDADAISYTNKHRSLYRLLCYQIDVLHYDKDNTINAAIEKISHIKESTKSAPITKEMEYYMSTIDMEEYPIYKTTMEELEEIYNEIINE